MILTVARTIELNSRASQRRIVQPGVLALLLQDGVFSPFKLYWSYILTDMSLCRNSLFLVCLSILLRWQNSNALLQIAFLHELVPDCCHYGLRCKLVHWFSLLAICNSRIKQGNNYVAYFVSP